MTGSVPVINGIFLVVAIILLVIIYRRLDGTTPAEMRGQIHALSGLIVRTQGEVGKLAGEFERQLASMDELRREFLEMKVQMATLQRVVCNDCPRLLDDSDQPAGFRRLGGK